MGRKLLGGDLIVFSLQIFHIRTEFHLAANVNGGMYTQSCAAWIRNRIDKMSEGVFSLQEEITPTA